MTTTTTTAANTFLPPLVVVLAIAVAGAFLLRAIDAEVCKDGELGSWVLNSELSAGAVDAVPLPTCAITAPKAGEFVTVPMPRPDPRKTGGL